MAASLYSSYHEPVDHVNYDSTKLMAFATIAVEYGGTKVGGVSRKYLLEKKISLLVQLWSHYPEGIKKFKIHKGMLRDLVRQMLNSAHKKGTFTCIDPRINTEFRFFLHLKSPMELTAGVRHLLIALREVPLVDYLGTMVVPLVKEMVATGRYTGEECSLADFTWVKTEEDLGRYIEQLPDEI